MRRIGTGVTGKPILGRLLAIDDRLRTIRVNEDINLQPSGDGVLKVSSDVEIENGSSLTIKKSDNTNNIKLVAPSGLSQDITLTLPTTTSANTVLTTDANGNLTFSNLQIGTQDVSSQNTTYFPVITTSNTGTVSNFQVSSQTITMVPSAGRLNLTEVRATGDVTAFFSSDISLKENILNIENSLDKIKNLNGVEYDWTDEYIQEQGGEDGYFIRKHDVGLIAQEVEEVLPEVVATNKKGYKSVKYDRIVALLVEGIKELKKEIDDLKQGL